MEKHESIEINGEKVYLKKSKIFGWGIVYPNKNEDGTYNWFNLLTGGSWLRLFIVIAIVLLVLGIAYEYMSNLAICQQYINYYNLKNNINLSLWR